MHPLHRMPLASPAGGVVFGCDRECAWQLASKQGHAFCVSDWMSWTVVHTLRSVQSTAWKTHTGWHGLHLRYEQGSWSEAHTHAPPRPLHQWQGRGRVLCNACCIAVPGLGYSCLADGQRATELWGCIQWVKVLFHSLPLRLASVMIPG